MSDLLVAESGTATGRRTVGTSVTRIDGRAKARGEALYTGDLRFDSMAHAELVRSSVAHGRLVSVDTTQARATPGVLAVLTGADLMDLDPYFGHAVRDQPILVIDKVRFCGEPVAIVVAESREIAVLAAALVEIEVDELPYVTTVEQAMEPGAPRVHEDLPREGAFIGLTGLTSGEGNVVFRQQLGWGEVDDLLAQAEVLVEGTYRFPAVYQYAMEPHAVVAHWESDRLTIWAASQHPFFVRAQLAELFNMAASDVRIVVPFIGGGFGSKSYIHTEPMAAIASKRVGRPVRLVNDVSAAMLTSRRHDMVCHMRTAAKRDGTLVARSVELAMNTGAYADNGPRVTFTALDAACSPYRWQALTARGATVYTNTSPAGSYRGFGAAHVQWAGELQIDDIARKIGMDPVDMRLKNLKQRGEIVRPGARPLDADLIGNLERLVQAVGWKEPRRPDEGIGIALGLMPGGARPVSSADVRCDMDGVVTIRVGTTEMGQGARTVMSQIAAEVLGVPYTQLRVEQPDTASTPYDSTTGASRSTTVMGKAVELAALDVARQVKSIAADRWGVAADEVVLDNGRATHGDHSATLGELVRAYYGFPGGEIAGRGEVRATSDGMMPVFWEVCMGAAVVSVDRDTGEVVPRRLVTIADVGCAINPQLVEIQDEGAAVQGIGVALHEELHWVDGMLVNDSLLDYHVPTFENLPEQMTCIIVENGDGPGPFGAKGVGEGAHAGAIAAIACAIGDAGIPVRQLPATPERVWSWLQAAETEGV